MDAHANLRSLSFPDTASLLGISLERFKHQRQEWRGPCPVCNPKKNATAFNYNDSGKWHCFGCESKGSGAIDLTMQVLKIGFKDACERLGAIKPTPAKEKQPVEAVESSDGALKPLLKDSWSKFKVPCPWLETRCPDAAVRDAYGIYCYSNPARKSAYSGRVMIPIRDVKGQLFGYLGRSTLASDHSDSGEQDHIPKYLFPRDFPKSKFLFGCHELATGQFLQSVRSGEPYNGSLPLKVCYLVESPFAVLKFASLGLPAVSPFGWSVSEEQLNILAQIRKGVVYIPDRNKSHTCGDVVQTISRSLWLRFPPLPAGIDDPENLDLAAIQALTR